VRGRRRWAVKLGVGLVLVITMLALVTWVLMSLWNVLVPELFRGPTLGFWQAAGLLVLARILFGSWRGRGWHRGWRRRHFKERWQSMTPEERDRLRERLGRCGWRSPPDVTQGPASEDQEAQAK
jgi:hypothetical protein